MGGSSRVPPHCPLLQKSGFRGLPVTRPRKNRSGVPGETGKRSCSKKAATLSIRPGTGGDVQARTPPRELRLTCVDPEIWDSTRAKPAASYRPAKPPPALRLTGAQRHPAPALALQTLTERLRADRRTNLGFAAGDS
jgi:hypothetical protein